MFLQKMNEILFNLFLFIAILAYFKMAEDGLKEIFKLIILGIVYVFYYATVSFKFMFNTLKRFI